MVFFGIDPLSCNTSVYFTWFFFSKSFTGLNRDTWHSVVVRIDVHGAKLLAKVDNESAEISLQGLDKASNYGISMDLMSVVLIGGEYPQDFVG